MAEYERTLIAERMRRGRLAKLRAGLLLPWTRPPYGYRLHPDHSRDPAGVTVDPNEAAIVAELFVTYLQPAVTLARLAKALQRRAIPTPLGKGSWTSPVKGLFHALIRSPACDTVDLLADLCAADASLGQRDNPHFLQLRDFRGRGYRAP